ncbi:nif-specific transcriptional activator NifA [Methylobacterium nodulans]|uniref:Nif-specific regulatory protein n=1 Tax=Methylobacterium nodulans (strain LMG 21967 / CNCM I-2342 / ORS 2060) TaxID=460265 RepID=B8ITH3_METNO|nr:nif-specific transcriptional activator NifA [Methylobacterium nodulans]ACL58889.1 transcriptional regulator, NifA, Fis Family [Methylobacterium nodulans ORS 2060]
MDYADLFPSRIETGLPQVEHVVPERLGQQPAPPSPTPRLPVQARPASASRGTSAEVQLIGIYEISKALTAVRHLEVTLTKVIDILSSTLSMHHGMIVILDQEGGPEIVSSTGWTAQIAHHLRACLPQRAIDQIVDTAAPLVVQDVSADPLFHGHLDLFEDAGKAITSFIGVPIKADSRVLGTLSIDRICDGSARFCSDEDTRFLTMVANLIGQTVWLHNTLAQDRDRLIAKAHRLEKALAETSAISSSVGLVGESQELKRLAAKAEVAARSNTTVLLRGESGTGKELFARAIHELSPRKSKPFVRVNCAALADSVLESELFGHEKGAFTGAIATRHGRFEAANGGTLFLDEIGEVSATFQAKLLRVLQEGEFERVGGNRTIKVDVRLVFATNRNLEEAVTKGDFRADLYYRINVVSLILPPLRERRGDIPDLAKAFLTRYNSENGSKLAFSQGAMGVLLKCYFPGNVRELENCVRGTATLAASEELIMSDDFACVSGQCLSAVLWKRSTPKPWDAAVTAATPVPVSPERPPTPAEAEPPASCPGAKTLPGVRPRPTKQQLLEALERTGYVQAKAARLLEITPRQLGYAVRKYDIPLKEF